MHTEGRRFEPYYRVKKNFCKSLHYGAINVSPFIYKKRTSVEKGGEVEMPSLSATLTVTH
jgi:hypothetical protein